jgi:hypothetical protein
MDRAGVTTDHQLRFAKQRCELSEVRPRCQMDAVAAGLGDDSGSVLLARPPRDDHVEAVVGESPGDLAQGDF